jgi:hypothetical protein
MALLSDKTELADMLAYAESVGRGDYVPLSRAELDQALTLAPGHVSGDRRVSGSTGYYCNYAKEGAPSRWSLVAIGPHAWNIGRPIAEWLKSLPKRGAENSDRWVVKRFYSTYEPATPILDTVKEGDFAFAKLRDGSGVVLALVIAATDGKPDLVDLSMSESQQRRAADLSDKWQVMPERQEECAKMFQSGRTRFPDRWQFGCQIGRRHRRDNLGATPLKKNETAFAPGNFVCGHMIDAPAYATQLGKVLEVDKSGRVLTVQIGAGEIVPRGAAKKWKLVEDRNGNCESLLADGGKFKSGFAFMRALRKLPAAKPRRAATDTAKPIGADPVALRVRRQTHKEAIAAGIPQEIAQRLAKAAFDAAST